ncbi:MAG: helix-turn-helix domain-containing protein [Desulfobulbaceae bacterium]|nr:helix-turn-helix domain-containing protein [Desulfobulbaceae bacterium]
MPQIQLPIFPTGSTHITSTLAFAREGNQITYFNGSMPVFSHDKNDLDSFKMITAQFYLNGNAKQAEIARAFGVSKISIKRAVKRYQESGPKGFYAPRKTRGASVLTPTVLVQAQQLLDDEVEPCDVADQLNIKRDTLGKAILAGRLYKPKKRS